VPIVIQQLPLKEDFEENTTVFTCLLKLYQEENPQVCQFMLLLGTRTSRIEDHWLSQNVIDE
jgi:hypothetical protein